MHAADAASGENFHTRQMSGNHGRGHCGRTVFAAGQQNGQVTAAGLDDLQALFAKIFDLFLGNANAHLAAQNGDGGGNRAVFTDDGFNRQRGLHILGVGHSVRNDGGLQSHDRLIMFNSFLYFVRYPKIILQIHLTFPPSFHSKSAPRLPQIRPAIQRRVKRR